MLLLRLFLELLSIISTITRTIAASNNLIHNGHNTSNKDQLITPTSFNTISTMARTLHIPKPLLFFGSESIYVFSHFIPNIINCLLPLKQQFLQIKPSSPFMTSSTILLSNFRYINCL